MKMFKFEVDAWDTHYFFICSDTLQRAIEVFEKKYPEYSDKYIINSFDLEEVAMVSVYRDL